MVDGPLVNIPDLTRPAVVLLEKISDAVGGLFAPMQLRRMAKAEADALKITALAEMELTEIQTRAFERLVREEETKQRNMEDITARALPDLRPDSKPETLENDWIAHFYDRCRHTTSEEMQGLWARLLALFRHTHDGYHRGRPHVLLSQAGRELAPLCGAAPVKVFLDYVRAEWIKRGASVDIHTTP